MESLTELERQFQESVKEAEASLKKRDGLPELTVEQKARMVNIIKTLEAIHVEFFGKKDEAQTLLQLPENLNPSTLKFFMDLGRVLAECATEADRLRVRIERGKASEDLAHTVQASRREDLATMIHYLDKVAQQVGDLVTSFEDELSKQGDHRKREQGTLDRLDKVLKNYE